MFVYFHRTLRMYICLSVYYYVDVMEYIIHYLQHIIRQWVRSVLFEISLHTFYALLCTSFYRLKYTDGLFVCFDNQECSFKIILKLIILTPSFGSSLIHNTYTYILKWNYWEFRMFIYKLKSAGAKENKRCLIVFSIKINEKSVGVGILENI